MTMKKQIWDKWEDTLYACDKDLTFLSKRKNRLFCRKCRSYWITDEKKGVKRHATPKTSDS